MTIISSIKAHELGSQLAHEISARQPAEAYAILASVLAERTPFRLLDIIGESMAECPAIKLDPFLDEIAAHTSIGGWTVIASALRARIPAGLAEVLERTYGFIIQADTWYACDCLGERVLGQAVVDQFQPALRLLSPWRTDENHWVRRAVGVTGHLWAKRAKGTDESHAQVSELLDFYSPMLDERQIDAAKGVGWALKTLGRYYPERVFNFLIEHKDICLAAVIRRKALKFLPEKMKAQLRR